MAGVKRFNLKDEPLLMAATVVDDLERVRIANQNRYRQMTRGADELDADGESRGFGLSQDHPDVKWLGGLVDTLVEQENIAVRRLESHMRKHPLGPWMKETRGVGAKQLARLLACIGDPVVNSATGAPRTPAQLWAYCGLHVKDGAAPRRQRGVKMNWSADAKTRCYLIAMSCMKQLVAPCTALAHANPCRCSPYRVVYDERRRHTALTHPDWTLSHSHNDGLRIAAKRMLLELWRAARDVKDANEGTGSE